MSGDILKEKIREIINDYVVDGKKMLGLIKYKSIHLITKIKEDLNDPSTRKKYIRGLSVFVIFLLLVVINSSYGYYGDTASIPLARAKVGNLYLNDKDYVLLIYLQNTSQNNDGSKDYHLSSNIPSIGYEYSGYKCQNDSTLVFNEDSLTASATINKKDTCSVYFDMVAPLDVTINVMLEDNVGSDTYTLGTNIPYYGYKYNNFDCTNNSELTYDSNLHKVTLKTPGKDVCNLYFKKDAADVIVNLYVENTLDTEDYIKRFTIPTDVNYSLNSEKSVCKNNNERVENNITYVDGYINLDTQVVTECDVYLDRNE